MFIHSGAGRIYFLNSRFLGRTAALMFTRFGGS
jgi:hypothetical protein